MKLISRISASVLLAVSLAGCAASDPKVWYQPDRTDADLRKDWAESQLAARKAALGIKQPLVIAEDGFAAGLAASAHRDAKKAAKEIAPLTMQARGYQLVPLSTVPTNAPYLRP
jgi:hypothetical protein